MPIGATARTNSSTQQSQVPGLAKILRERKSWKARAYAGEKEILLHSFRWYGTCKIVDYRATKKTQGEGYPKVRTRNNHFQLEKLSTLPIALLGASIVLAALITACPMPNVNPASDMSSGGSSESSSDNNSGESGVLVLNVNYQNAKTLAPVYDMTPGAYEFRGNGPNGKSFSVNGETTPIEIRGLDFGEWIIFADAKNADGAYIANGQASVVLHIGNAQTVNITVTPLDGYGTLDLTVNWPPENTDIPSVESQLAMKSGATIDLDFQIVEPGKARLINDQLPTGYHTVVIQLMDNGVLIMGAIEVVRIVKDQTTEGVFDFSETNMPGGTFIVNMEMKDPIQVSMNWQLPELVLGEQVTVTASVPPQVGTVVYVWYLNGQSKATGSSFAIGNDVMLNGIYRLDVTAFTVNGLRAGSATHYFRVIEGAEVALEWDPNTEDDLAGYRLYYGLASGDYDYSIDVGNQTTYTLTGLRWDRTYYMAVTAYNEAGLESDYSNEVVFTP